MINEINSKLESDLEPYQRLHLHILIQARQDYLTALHAEYIDEGGNLLPQNFRYKGSGTKLVGGFSIPMTISSLEELCKYWKSNTPNLSLAILKMEDMSPSDFLNKLKHSLKFRKSKPSKLPLDEL
jgi:hypothetical protein